jgi:hypothetical protein
LLAIEDKNLNQKTNTLNLKPHSTQNKVVETFQPLKIERCKQNTMSRHDYKESTTYHFSQKTFFIRMNFGTKFLQFVIIIAYSCPST